MIERFRSAINEHDWLIDLALIAVLVAAAAALRLALLGEIPYGIHADEAQAGIDAQRILDGDLLGPYTRAALGQPSGHSYLVTPSIWLFGNEAFALRLPLALVATAAVPLLYLYARTTLGRAEAFFAGAMLALSYWHLLYSRVAHWSISYGTVVLAVLLCLLIGLQQKRRAWIIAGGVLLGLGVYTYNIYPIAIVAVLAATAVLTMMRAGASDDRGWWFESLGWGGASAVAVALPMIVYIANPDAYFWTHMGNYADNGLLRSDEFSDASVWGKIDLILDQAGTFARNYVYEGVRDYVDAAGQRAVFDPLTLILLAAGMVIAVRKRANPAIVAALCCLIIIPLPAVLQRGSITRQPLGAAPFAMLIAALPLAAMWREAVRGGATTRGAVLAGVTVAFVAGIGLITVRDYFWTWRESDLVRETYFSEMTSASTYMRDLPGGSYIYFYSDRGPYELEMRRFLAPDIEGEDRSLQFSPHGGSIYGIVRSRPISFVLLGRYVGFMAPISARYPGGNRHLVYRDGKLEFMAYELPAAAIGAPTEASAR